MTAATRRDAIIHLRLSEFRDDDDITFDMREAELRQLADGLGLNVIRVVIENDLDGNGKSKPASAYKTTLKVTANGLTTFRTDRPEFASVLRQLQRGRDMVLIVGDDSRLSRNERDGADLIDAVAVGRASVLAPDDDGRPRWILTDGGSHAEVSAFRDRINDARKYSADIAAKVRKGRRRWAGTSYGGGRRPYGYRPDPDAPQHRKTLIKIDAEAGVIRQAATDILDRDGISLKAIARDLRDRRVPTVTGAAWSAKTLREVLIKPAVAGLVVKDGALVPAPGVIPEPILGADRWEKLRDKLTDPSRRTNASRANEPRWLLSGFAVCGVCGGPLRASGGKNRAYAYIGNGCCHVRRNAAKVDAAIESAVLAVLGRDDAADLLRPPARPDVDTPKLRAELRKLRDRRAVLAAMFADGDLGEPELRAGQRRLAGRETAIAAQLADSDLPDPLAEFRGQPARAVWSVLPMARRRAVVQTLIASVVIKPAGRRGAGFDPGTLGVTWRVRPLDDDNHTGVTLA
jgi:DNA invertase Pin-like site-specific DNA recombinase